MSIIEQQKELEYYPDEVLAQEMMQPTGIAPSFLVATEIKRRNDMRNSYQAQMNPQPQTSVVEEEAMELGGIANADPNAMQQQMMQQPMPQQQMPQNAPMPMREGGNIRYQEGEDIDFDETGGFIRGPMGRKMLGKDGWLYDPSSKLDNALLAASVVLPFGGRLATGAGLLGKAGIKGAVQGAKALKGKIAEGIGSIASKRGFVPNYGGKTSIPLSEVGSQATKAFANPFPLSLSSPFWSTTAPIGAAGGLLAGGGGEDSGIETESDASIIEAVNAEEVTNNNDPRLEGKTLDEMAKILGDDNRQRQALADKLAADKAAEDAERDRRAALPDSARMLEDAMANVPENQTFQDYLSTLEGMEESRKGQVLMDLGASIANASHGGDIAKGFQEAGTRARAEKIEVAKETARVLGESRAMDIDVAIKMATIQADLEKQTGRTLQELLALLQMDEDFITDNYPDSADAIMEQIRAAIEVSLPQATEQSTE